MLRLRPPLKSLKARQNLLLKRLSFKDRLIQNRLRLTLRNKSKQKTSAKLAKSQKQRQTSLVKKKRLSFRSAKSLLKNASSKQK